MLFRGELKNLKDIILIKCTEYADRIAFLEKDKTTKLFKEITYSKLKQDVISLATVLNNKYNLKGKKIAVIGENSYKWYVSYMAVTTGVGVIVPLDKELPENEIENLMKKANVGAIIYATNKEKVIFEVRKKLSKDIMYINMDRLKDDDDSYFLDNLILEGNNILNEGNKDYENEAVDPNEFRILLFTSGTTSNAKGIMLSHANVIANLDGATEVMPLKGTDTFISILPIHHIYESIVTYMYGISNGVTIGICENLKSIPMDIKVIKPTILVTVPILLEFILNRINKEIASKGKETQVETIIKITDKLGVLGRKIKRKLFKDIHNALGGRVRNILVSAAPVPKELIERAEDFGYVIFQGYGLSETAPLVSATRLKTRTAGTVGQASNCEIKLKSPDENGVGEILVKGPNVMIGYFEDEEATKEAIQDGWFNTGDLGYFDKKNNLLITGRSKSVIITGNGKNIYPEEIENEINKLEMIKESLVYGEDDENDTVLSAVVTLDEDYIKETYGDNRPDDRTLKEIIFERIKEINKKMVSYKAVKRLNIRKQDFVKTTTMKIKRFLESNKNEMGE